MSEQPRALIELWTEQARVEWDNGNIRGAQAIRLCLKQFEAALSAGTVPQTRLLTHDGPGVLRVAAINKHNELRQHTLSVGAWTPDCREHYDCRVYLDYCEHLKAERSAGTFPSPLDDVLAQVNTALTRAGSRYVVGTKDGRIEACSIDDVFATPSVSSAPQQEKESRMKALAVFGAERIHDYNVDAVGYSPLRAHVGYFDQCQHADCILVRSLRPSVSTPDHEPK